MALRICCSHRLYGAAGRRFIASASHSRPVTCILVSDRQWFSNSSQNDAENDTSKHTDAAEPLPSLLYEGPFAQLSLRLKRVSVTTAALGVVGMPLLMAMHGGDVPATGQLAVGGTAILAAAGSTVALSFCFSPYVHKLERVVVTPDNEKDGDTATAERNLIKATTANILGMRVETIFDPATDVGKAAGSRPFCNFTAKGLPMYVHPDMVYDDELRLQLVGEAELELQEKAKEAAKKNKQDDDEFL